MHLSHTHAAGRAWGASLTLAAVCGLLAPAAATAQTIEAGFIATSGSWHDVDNWDFEPWPAEPTWPNNVPGGASYEVWIDFDKAVRLDQAVEIDALYNDQGSALEMHADLRLNQLDFDTRGRIDIHSGARLTTPAAWYEWSEWTLHTTDFVLHHGSVEVTTDLALNTLSRISTMPSTPAPPQTPNYNMALHEGHGLEVHGHLTVDNSLLIDGGRLSFGSWERNAGATWTHGEIAVTDDDLDDELWTDLRSIAVQPHANPPSLNPGQSLVVDNQLRLFSSSVPVRGGSLTVGEIFHGPQGIIAYESGQVRITDGDLIYDPQLHAPPLVRHSEHHSPDAWLTLHDDDAIEVAGTLATGNVPGRFAIDGGRLAAGEIVPGSIEDVIDFRRGELEITNGDLNFADEPLLRGWNVQLQAGDRITVGGTTTVGNGREIHIDGGSLSTGQLATDDPANLVFESGTLAITDGDLKLAWDTSLPDIEFTQYAGGFGHEPVIAENMDLAVAGDTHIDELRIDGGRFATGTLTRTGDGVKLVAGEFALTDSGMLIEDGPDAPMGDQVLLVDDQHLSVSGTTTVGAWASLAIEGGQLTTSGLQRHEDGWIDFAYGTVRFTGDMAFNPDQPSALDTGWGIELEPGQTLIVDGTTTLASEEIRVDGGVFKTGQLVNAIHQPGMWPGQVTLDQGHLVITDGDLRYHYLDDLPPPLFIPGQHQEITPGQHLEIAGTLRMGEDPGDPQLSLVGGSLTVGAIHDPADQFAVHSGSLTFTGDMRVTEQQGEYYVWPDLELTVEGRTVIESHATLHVGGHAFLADMELQPHATVDVALWEGDATLDVGGTLSIADHAMLDVAFGRVVANDVNIAEYGELYIGSQTGVTSEVYGHLDSHGVVSAAGHLKLTGDSHHRGGLWTGQLGRLEFADGHHVLDDVVIAGPGFELSGGTLEIRGSVTPWGGGSPPPHLTVAGGELTGDGELTLQHLRLEGGSLNNSAPLDTARLTIVDDTNLAGGDIVARHRIDWHDHAHLHAADNATLTLGDTSGTWQSGFVHGGGTLGTPGETSHLHLKPGAWFGPLGDNPASDILTIHSVVQNEGELGAEDARLRLMADSHHTGSLQSVADGRIEFAGDALHVLDDAGLDGQGFELTSGSLEIRGHVGPIHSSETPALHITGGTLKGNGTLHANVTNDDTTSPGNSTGTLVIEGDYTQGPDGRLIIEIDEQGYDQLIVTGQTSLAGELEIHLAPGVELDAWQELQFLVADGGKPAGGFTNVSLHGADDDNFAHVEATAEGLTMSLGLVGDMNRDGVINTADVAPFVLALTDATSYEAQYGLDPEQVGDINGDGAFNTADVAPFVQLLVGEGSSTVPEPSSLALLAISAAALLGRRRR